MREYIGGDMLSFLWKENNIWNNVLIINGKERKYQKGKKDCE